MWSPKGEWDQGQMRCLDVNSHSSYNVVEPMKSKCSWEKPHTELQFDTGYCRMSTDPETRTFT